MMLNDLKYRKIVNEWFAKLDRGYAEPPYSRSDLDLLYEIVDKYESQLNEAAVDFMSDVQSFQNYINSNYVVKSSDIKGLPQLYNIVKNIPNIQSIIDFDYSRNLQTTKYSMTSNEKALFDAISSVIKVNNGDPSELWFAIIYNGKVKGAVKGRTIVSDVEVTDQDVSLKNYSSLRNIDFGTLSGDAWNQVFDLLQIANLITNVKINPSMTRDSINLQMKFLSEPDTQQQIQDIMKMAQTTNLAVIRNISNKFKSIIGSDDPNDISNLIQSILIKINEAIEDKLKQVEYWSIVFKGAVYIESYQNIYNALKADPDSNQLPKSITQFKGSKLYVNGTYIHNEIIN